MHYKQVPNFTTFPGSFRDIIVPGIAINSGYTSRVMPDKDGGLPNQIGNKTECALLGFVLDMKQSYEEVRSDTPEGNFTKVYTFNSVRKSMSTVVPRAGGGYRLYTKGASEIVLKK